MQTEVITGGQRALWLTVLVGTCEKTSQREARSA